MKIIATLFIALIFTTQMTVNYIPQTKRSTVEDKPIVKQLPSETVKKEQSFEQVFDKQIEQWVNTLADTQGFEAWQDSTWKSYPLGPGTHGWVILISNSNQEVGYLVVHTSPEGEFLLSEYGVGEYPLFSLNTLNRTLIQHALIPKQESMDRIYLNAFQAVWRLTGKEHVYYFDGVTGEAFPLNERDLTPSETETNPFISGPLTALNKNHQIPWFDPYEQLNWINHTPIEVETFQDLDQALSQPPHQITYTASIFDDNMLIPLAIMGYHLWDEEEAYIAIDQHSLRFIPFSTVLQQGVFYQK